MVKKLLLALLLCALGFPSAACHQNRTTPSAEAPPAAYQASPEPKQLKLAKVTAPRLGEVRDAVERVFKGAAVVDTTFEPNFFAGDFNGDESEDLAVILKALPDRLDLLNEQYPAWMIRNPAGSNSPTQLRIVGNETLLAIIHGFGVNDWRDSQATQTFVLKNSVGTRIEVNSGQQFLAANSGRKIPQPEGDLIAEVVKGTPGYIYFSGSNYSWYDPKTYQPEVERRMVHMRQK